MHCIYIHKGQSACSEREQVWLTSPGRLRRSVERRAEQEQGVGTRLGEVEEASGGEGKGGGEERGGGVGREGLGGEGGRIDSLASSMNSVFSPSNNA